MKGYIYTITHNSGKTYVGQTIQKPKYRWKAHEKGGSYIGKAIRKYGLEQFNFDIIQEIELDDKYNLQTVLNKLEIYYIDLFDSIKSGYNLIKGGEGVKPSGTFKHSDKTKRKISESRIGEKNWNYGKKFSDEHRRKLSESHKGQVISKEQRKKISKTVSKIQKKKVQCVETGVIFGSNIDAAHHINMSTSSISRAIKYNKLAGGYHWIRR